MYTCAAHWSVSTAEDNTEETRRTRHTDTLKYKSALSITRRQAVSPTTPSDNKIKKQRQIISYVPDAAGCAILVLENVSAHDVPRLPHMILQVLPLRLESQIADEDAPSLDVIAISVDLLTIVVFVDEGGGRVRLMMSAAMVVASTSTTTPTASTSHRMVPGSAALRLIIVVVKTATASPAVIMMVMAISVKVATSSTMATP